MATKSKALQRVEKNIKDVKSVSQPAYEGFYLTNDQIIELGNNLKKIRNDDGDCPDGLYFLIGKKGRVKSIELIPFVVEGNNLKVFSEKDSVGSISIKLSKGPLQRVPFCYPSDGVDRKAGSGQKTPPPKI